MTVNIGRYRTCDQSRFRLALSGRERRLQLHDFSATSKVDDIHSERILIPRRAGQVPQGQQRHALAAAARAYCASMTEADRTLAARSRRRHRNCRVMEPITEKAGKRKPG